MELKKIKCKLDIFYFCRWRNWWIRGVFTLVMFGGFGFIIYLGPSAILLLVRIFSFSGMFIYPLRMFLA